MDLVTGEKPFQRTEKAGVHAYCPISQTENSSALLLLESSPSLCKCGFGVLVFVENFS